jgi:hypothetical protein
MTFEGWFRTNAAQTGGPTVMVIGAINNFLSFSNDVPNRLRVKVGSANTLAYLAITTGAWYHVAVTYDANALDGNIFKVYLNGALASSSTLAWASYTPAAGAKVLLPASATYTGALRGVRIWNYARSQKEINDWRFRNANSLDPRLLFHVPVIQDDHQNEKQAATANQLKVTDTMASPWSLVRSTKTNNAATDPLGGNTAIKLAVDASGTTSHYVRYQATADVDLWTFEVFVKAAEMRYVWLAIDLGFIGGGNQYLFFDMLTGVFTTAPDSRYPYYSSLDVGNGWYVLTLTGNIVNAVADYLYIGAADTPTSTVTTAAVGSGIYVWGPQWEKGFPTPYAANPTSTAGGTPRTADRPAIGTNTFGQDGGGIDAVYKDTVKGNFAETLTLAEVGWRGPEGNYPETLAVAEVYSDLFNAIMNIGETVNFADVCKKDASIIKAEVMALAEVIRKGPGLNVGETLALAESYTAAAGFIRVIAETLNIVDAVRKNPTKNVPELLRAIDYILRKGDGVLADASFENVFLTPEAFIARFVDPVPPGYTGWTQFLPGDYEYKTALVETKLIREHLTQDTRLTRSEIRADMPDLLESGEYTVALTSGTETVSLTKPFTAVNDVQITGVSGAVVTTPRVPSYTTTGFNIELRDSANVRQVGVIRYTVRGY